MLALLIGAGLVWRDPALREGIGLPMAAGEVVEARFVLCDSPGYSSHCVVDGDTFRIGNRRIRVEGIDAPERDGQCEAERAGARRATADLLNWLERGAFEMVAPGDVPRDQYGRELQSVWRSTDGGGRDDLARHMITAGSAVRYDSRNHMDWC